MVGMLHRGVGRLMGLARRTAGIPDPPPPDPSGELYIEDGYIADGYFAEE